jgi:magnesium-transporting ATPase (P-type)
VALALPLAFEAMEPGLMRRPPRSPKAPVLNAFIMGRTAIMAILMAAGALGLFLLEYDSTLDAGAPAEVARSVAQTEAVLTVILFQIFYLFQCRSMTRSALSIGFWTNPWIFAGIAVVLLLQSIFIYAPFMNATFGSAPLDLEAWVEAVLVALIGVPVISVEKWWRGRRGIAVDSAASPHAY